MKTLRAVVCVVGGIAMAGCVADIAGDTDGAPQSTSAEDVGEAQESIVGHNCDEACTAALLIHLRFCNNRDFVSPALRQKCLRAAREAGNVCYFAQPDQGCQAPCAAGHARFNLFCPSIPKAKRYHCHEQNMEARAACVAAGSMSFRR
jgi:hypothetical protein